MTLLRFKNIKLQSYKPGKSLLAGNKNIIKLSANESALGVSKNVEKIVKSKFDISKYPDSKFSELTQKISKKYNCDKSKIICGSGSDEVIQMLCQLFLRENDEVVVPQYSFLMYRIYSKIVGANVKLAKEINFKVSVKEILKKTSKKTKIVFIANPNNPTGTYLPKKEMINLRKKLKSNILLVVDDAYFEYINSDNFESGLNLFKDSDNVLVTRTFSKIYGLAGLRLGWGYSSKKIIEAMYQIKPPFNVNRAALAAGIEAIKDIEWTNQAIEYNLLWSKKIFSVLKENKIKTNEPSANFFLMNFAGTKFNSDKVFEKLANNRLILRKMSQYKIHGGLRLTIGNKEANEHFIESVESIFK